MMAIIKFSTTIFFNGEVIVVNSDETGSTVVTYYPNGTVTATRHIWEVDNVLIQTYTSENITQYPLPLRSYEEILKQNPIQTNDDIANLFVNHNKNTFYAIDKEQLDKQSILVFTADYGLYWWDFKGGYDLVLAELAWNHSDTQQISLVRGAANIQGKSWGTILTWKYTHPPFLAEGDEMFEQMKTSYQTGAEYVIIFNYSEDSKNPHTLQDEHFQALERFWSEVVQNPDVEHGGIKAEAALVLPKNYGWGMRAAGDNIWGIWPADNTTQKIWNQLQEKTEQHGLKLDIIFEDPNHPVKGKYEHVYYVEQKTPTLIIMLTVLLISVLVALFVITFKIASKKHRTTKSIGHKVAI
ncbi:MAG: hypothetical protein LBC03_06450 [Nitrososphaerota archaeon]|jgi:hypothetical protein|nr:hypothetical protein [Nitrososphaerota archaeon]